MRILDKFSIRLFLSGFPCTFAIPRHGYMFFPSASRESFIISVALDVSIGVVASGGSRGKLFLTRGLGDHSGSVCPEQRGGRVQRCS